MHINTNGANLINRARVPLNQRSGYAKRFAFPDRWSRETWALGMRLERGLFRRDDDEHLLFDYYFDSTYEHDFEVLGRSMGC